MKLHALCASAVALTLAFATPASARFDGNLRSFTIAATTSVMISLECGGNFELVEGALPKVADRNGVSSEEANAIFNAILAQGDQPYDRDALIPEITVVVRDTMNEAYAMLHGRDRAAMCGKVANSAVQTGFIRRK